MIMESTTRLTDDFLKTFNISRIIEQKPKSGQKQVYIVEIEGTTIALKIIPTIDERIIRELNIYEVFKEVSGIPCIIKIQKYGDELVVLEEYIDGEDLHFIKDSYLIIVKEFEN